MESCKGSTTLKIFVLARLAKGMFFQLHSKYKVGLSRQFLISCPVKQNTPIMKLFQSRRFHVILSTLISSRICSMKKSKHASCLKQMAVPSVYVYISYLGYLHLTTDLQTKAQRAIDKCTFASAILFLPEFHCSR